MTGTLSFANTLVVLDMYLSRHLTDGGDLFGVVAARSITIREWTLGMLAPAFTFLASVVFPIVNNVLDRRRRSFYSVRTNRTDTDTGDDDNNDDDDHDDDRADRNHVDDTHVDGAGGGGGWGEGRRGWTRMIWRRAEGLVVLALIVTWSWLLLEFTGTLRYVTLRYVTLRYIMLCSKSYTIL